MHLVQILIPVQPDVDDAHQLGRVRRELLYRFGGVTAYSRGPAQGLWRDDDSGEVVLDDVIVLEVMTEELDRSWWASYREELEVRLHQDEIIIRAQVIEQL